MKKNNLKGPKFSIRYWRISVTLRSGIAGFYCSWMTITVRIHIFSFLQ